MYKSIHLIILTFFIGLSSLSAQGFEGYYQNPDIQGNTIVFEAEGDIWKVDRSGGLAVRLTTHAESERYPKISPDGSTVAYSASYEGPTEVYTMPISGGLPMRWTYESDFSMVNTWTPDGKVAYDTRAYATQPERQVVLIDPSTKEKSRIELNQASEASFDASGKTIYFVRPAYHNNVTKRYKGGTARQVWKYTLGSDEAIKLTTDYAGESHHPIWYERRIYHLTDRDGIMNIWSIAEDGSDLQQHTTHEMYDVRAHSISEGHIIYQHAAELWDYNIATGESSKIDVRLQSDLDQLRENWVENPENYVTSRCVSPTGDRVAITARGRIFIVPVDGGRIVEFTEPDNVRYRDAIFSADGKSIIALSDESGEFEFVKMNADGTGETEQLTSDGNTLRYKGLPSPNGKYIIYDDLLSRVYVLNTETGQSNLISQNDENVRSFAWSPDSRYVAFVQAADNTMSRIWIHDIDQGDVFPITTDRANSFWPQWSFDGKFIYFLSDRNFQTLVGSPWGTRQPEPYYDVSEKIYHISLEKGTRSPFRPDDELYTEPTEKEDAKEVTIKIDRDGIMERIAEVPVPPGNYNMLDITEKALYVSMRETGVNAKTHLGVIQISNDDPKVTTAVEGINGFDISNDGKKILIRKNGSYYMANTGTGKIGNLNDNKINLGDWSFKINPREDWKQIFTDAWRMERDYFYDENMHGVNWDAMHDKYFPLTDRVTTRAELSDLIGRFVGELAALHTSVRGGDTRSDDSNIQVANLGARLERDESKDGYIIAHIYRSDPDYPDTRSPLEDPYLDISEGDVITAVNGKSSLESTDIGVLLRNKVGKQVRLTISQNGNQKDIIVKPMGNMYRLRYSDWEYSRRQMVESMSDEQIGYVHLQAMGSRDLNQWYREFYPVFNRQGLIIDVRNNRGGNIESFILEKLMRRAWMYWKSRAGKPYWNMPYSFRGHVVVLVNETTASDGEAFADGFRRLDLGKTIGTRTWGGEIWLNSANRLTDGGLARAPMNGVYGPEGEWLIEGHGFVPDIEVDNLPHATFKGEDAQLKAAIDYLQNLIKEDPREVPPPPPYPDKSFNNK